MLSAAEVPAYSPVKAELVRPRQGLGNVLAKLQQGEPVKIAYLGGSITEANGWRPKSLAWFQKEFPKSKIESIHAAIGGTGSDLGVFRLGKDVLQFHPDLLFVEFAVNDGGAPPERIWRAMEGIVRQTWAANPRTDICFVYTFRTGYEDDLAKGDNPRAASAMELLADHYGIPSVNFALKIYELQQAGKLIYKSDDPPPAGVIRFSQDGVHPLDEGHQIYTDVLADAVRQMHSQSAPVDHSSTLAPPFIADHWQAARMVPLDRSMLTGDWQELSAQAPLGKQFNNRMGTLWTAHEPGSRISFKFKGRVAQLYDLVGPNCGQVVISLDGQTRPKPVPRFDSYCTYFRTATLWLADGVDADKVHTVTIEIHPEQPDRAPVAFRLKDPETELNGPKYQGTNVYASQILVLGDVVAE
jgi:lysophospholipase L1-like esterase